MPSAAKPRVFKRGGARTRAANASAELTEKQVATLIAGICRAVPIGLPLNRFITIHWQRAGVPAREAARATARILKYVRDWLARQGLPFAYVWVRENDDGDGSKGDHVHILAHVPDGRSLGRLQRRWLCRITGQSYRQGVIRTRRVGGTADAARTAPEHYRANLGTVGAYVLKGGSEAATGAHGLWRWGDGGHVVGQRSGISRNLSRPVPNIEVG